MYTVIPKAIISIRKYVVSVLVSAVMVSSTMMACSTVQSTSSPSSSQEQNSRKGEVLLTEKERNFGEELILVGEFMRKYGQCTVYEQGKKEVCQPGEAITIGENVFLQKVVYNNTNEEEQYDSLEVHLSPFLHSQPQRNEVLKVDLNLEGIMHVDLSSRRFIYTKKVITRTYYEKPPGKNTVKEISCFDAQWQILPVENGECVYYTKE